MMNYPQNKTKQHQGAILGLLIAFIMIFAIGCETVEAYENNYVENFEFYYDDTDDLILEFFCKTTFTAYSHIAIKAQGYNWYVKTTYVSPPLDNSIAGIEPDLVNNQYIAGNTYKLYLKYFKKVDAGAYANYYLTKTTWETIKGSAITSDDYIQSWLLFYSITGGGGMNDILAYYSEYPTLSVSFPQNNAEIAEAFFIQGNYTIPAGSDYNKIVAYIGLGIPYAQYSFYQDITLESGSVNIRISGLPEGDDYRIFFYAVNSTGDNYYFSNNDLNISVVSAIPPELPGTEETPPEFFGVIPGIIFYPGHSNYATSTNLYLNLINTIEPIIITIGDNLTFFSSQFDQDIAKETGQRTGQAILMIRSYSSNLNTFFNDLPVSEFLFFYLMLLIIVVVFRLISKLINLIKP